MKLPFRMDAALAVLTALGPLVGASPAVAQGCEPIRFTSPVSLGGEGEAYQPGGQWQFTLAYRRLVSNEWFIGSKESSSLAPGGQSPIFRIHTVVADVSYAFNARFSAQLSVPVSAASFSRKWPDLLEHEQKATGIGDVTLMGSSWLFSPRTHGSGNIQLGLGVKAPTGSNKIGSKLYSARAAVDYPADQTIQPGDGGWAVMMQIQAFRKLSERTLGYAAGSYMASPKAHSDVAFAPGGTVYWSVPDVYSARIGGAFTVLPDQGLTMSLGSRIDGIPVHDLLGGGDDVTIKRTAYVIFAEPGLSLNRGNNSFTLSVPYRLKVNRQKSLLERRTNGVNGGGFAKYLVFASYSRRL
jgi:hypothetical protein